MNEAKPDAIGAQSEIRAALAAAKAELKIGNQLASQAIPAFARGEALLNGAAQSLSDHRLKALPACDVPITPYRKAHRPGIAARIDIDPELRAFVLSRIHSQTYVQIAQDIATHFPPERRVKKSAIQRWWRKSEDLRTKSHSE